MRRILATAIATTLLAASCGGSATSLSSKALEKAIENQTGENIDFSQNGDGFTVQTEDGSLSFGSGDNGSVASGTDADGNSFKFTDGQQVPDGFPLPMPDKVNVSYGSTQEYSGDTVTDTDYAVTFSFDPSRVGELVAFYEQALADANLNIVGSSRYEDSVSIVADLDKISVMVDMQNYGEYWEASVFWTTSLG